MQKMSGEKTMSIKENWLIAWCIIRIIHNTRNWNPYKESKSSLFKPRVTEEVKDILPIAKKYLQKREQEEEKNYYKSGRIFRYKNIISIYLKNKGFQKEWTGYKYTWVKIEESDVDF